MKEHIWDVKNIVAPWFAQTFHTYTDRRGRRSLQGVCAALLFLSNINLTHYTKKQGAESLMTQPLIFIDAPLIDYGYIDTHNTDITF